MRIGKHKMRVFLYVFFFMQFDEFLSGFYEHFHVKSLHKLSEGTFVDEDSR